MSSKIYGDTIGITSEQLLDGWSDRQSGFVRLVDVREHESGSGPIHADLVITFNDGSKATLDRIEVGKLASVVEDAYKLVGRKY